jgi:hypothetical protein
VGNGLLVVAAAYLDLLLLFPIHQELHVGCDQGIF